MPITNKELWDNQVKINNDPYGGACIKVARRVMELLDELKEFDPNELINRADHESKAGGITGFMAGCVVQIVGACHSRGNEFRMAWNAGYGVPEKESRGGTVNPAVITIEQKD
ncbi:MAG: hypothetical protein PVJ60_02210 [Phycisphaerales bacterium]|jgi:hypothetical protein